MVDKEKVINFLQDFGCAKMEHLQILFNANNDNFNNTLTSNMISKKGNIFIHNSQKSNTNMLIALDILCKYKKQGRLLKYYKGYYPIYISFLSKEQDLYHIIVADEWSRKGIIKLVNSYPLSMPKADKLILAFSNKEDLLNINCNIPFLYTVYPELYVLNNKNGIKS